MFVRKVLARVVLLGAVVVLMVNVAAVGAPAATAQPGNPTATRSPDQGGPGTVIGITGTNTYQSCVVRLDYRNHSGIHPAARCRA